MPVVKMPDGTLVDMPENPTPEQIGSLQKIRRESRTPAPGLNRGQNAYTDQQIEMLRATDPTIVRDALGRLTADQRNALGASIQAYNTRKRGAPSNPGPRYADDADPYASFSTRTDVDPYAAFSSRTHGENVGLDSGVSEDWQKRLKPFQLRNGQQTLQRDDGKVWVDTSKGAKVSGWVDPTSTLNEGGQLGVYTPPTMDRPAGADRENLVKKDRLILARLGMRLDKIDEAVSAYGYTPGEIAKGFSDPNGFYRKWIASNDLGLLGGFRRGVLGIDALLKRLAGDKASASLSDAKRMVSQAERNQVARGSETDSGKWYSDPVAKAGEAAPGMILSEVLLPAAGPGAAFSQRAAANAGKAHLTQFATGEGDLEDRLRSANTAAAVAPVVQGVAEKAVAPVARGLVNAVKGLWGRSITPNVSNVEGELVGNMKGRSGTVLQDDLEKQYTAARSRAAEPFNQLRTQDGTLDLQHYVNRLDRTMTELDNSGLRNKDVLIAEIKKFKEASLRGPNTWSKALDIGSDINAAISEAMAGANPDRNLARILRPLKDAHQQALDTAGAKFGTAYQEAKANWARNVVPWEDITEGGRFLQNFMKNPTPNDAMRALTMMGPDKAKIFVKQAGPEGRAALQAGLVQTVFEEAQDPISREFTPGRFLKALNDREDLYGSLFQGQDKWKMDGFRKLMQNAYFVDHFLPGKWGISASQVAQRLFTSKAGANLLLGASSLNPTSKAMNNLAANRLPTVLGVAAGQGATPDRRREDLKGWTIGDAEDLKGWTIDGVKE